MSNARIEIFQIYYVMNYCGKTGYKGRYKKSIGYYDILIKNVSNNVKLNFMSTEVGETPSVEIFGYYTPKCELAGKFIDSGTDTGSKIYDKEIRYYPGLLKELKCRSPVNVLMPGMGIKIHDNGGFLYDLPNNSEWLIIATNFERQLPSGLLTFKLSLAMYPVQELETKVINEQEESE